LTAAVKFTLVDNIFPYIWFVLIASFVIFALVSQSRQSKVTTETYRRAASRFSGRFIDGGLFGRPSFSFAHHDVRVMVDIFSSGGKNARYYTQVHLAWPDSRARCEVYPERFSSRLGKFLGMSDLEIGSPEFDREFIITGSSADAVRELLTPDVQLSIVGLRRMGIISYQRSDDIYVSISGGKMLVKKLGYIREEARLVQYIEAVLDLYERAVGRTGTGIEFLGEATLSASAEVVCQICGEMIMHELVHCRRCKTPHHEDCWEYFGGCSTFGCGEKRFNPRKS
jgi:hypothetical protein